MESAIPLIDVYIPQDVAYLIPIGDIHYEDRLFTEKSRRQLLGYLDWVKETREARIFFMGDLFNTASRDSVTSPHNQKMNAYTELCKLFEPFKKQIIGAIIGNHEARLLDDYNANLLEAFCCQLGIKYCGWNAVLKFRVGKRKEEPGKVHQVYYIYCHHTTGGGATIGGKLNRVEKLRNIIEGMDVYCGGHSHGLGAVPIDIFVPKDRRIVKRRVWFVNTGGYLEWGGYVAQKMLQPTKIGSPRIRMSGKRDKHDVHVSL